MTTSALRESLAGNTPGGASLPSLDLSGVLGTLPARLVNASKSFFVAPLTIVALGIAQTNSAQFRADTSHDFVAYLASYTVRDNGSGAIIADPNILVRFTDEQNRVFGPIGAAGQAELRNVAGASAGTPGILPVPLIVSAGTALNAEFANQTGVVVNVRLALIGFLAGARA